MKYLKRLRGHSSYITHLDWSFDNNLIQSTCGSYEILYWDVASGKQLLSSMDSLEADTKW
jgi:microtubule-associated protein-like 4